MPVPGPPRQQCARYSAAGRRCETLTARFDGWCGECDGFTQAIEPSLEERERKIAANRAARERAAANPGYDRVYETPPLSAEDLGVLEVGQAAIRNFLERHGGSEAAARQQILSLVEDCVTSGSAHRRPSGYWTLSVKKGAYNVSITPDLDLVTNYRTLHAERTWAQVKAGVKSRLSARPR